MIKEFKEMVKLEGEDDIENETRQSYHTTAGPSNSSSNLPLILSALVIIVAIVWVVCFRGGSSNSQVEPQIAQITQNYTEENAEFKQVTNNPEKNIEIKPIKQNPKKKPEVKKRTKKMPTISQILENEPKIPKDKYEINCSSAEDLVIAIDFGTQNTIAAIRCNGQSYILMNGYYNSTNVVDQIFPSIVCFEDNKKAIIGNITLRIAETNPQKCIISPKKYIGKTIDEVSSWIKDLPYPAKQIGENICFDLPGIGLVCANEATSLLFKHIKETAERFTNSQINSTIITVPIYYDTERRAIKEAAKQIFPYVLIYDEPLAASVLYQHELKVNLEQKVSLLIDFGAGTLDIVLFILEKTIKLESQSGDPKLGGDDFTKVIHKQLLDFLKKKNINVSKEEATELKFLAEKIKIKLSKVTYYEIEFQNILDLDHSLVFNLTRKNFYYHSRFLFQRFEKSIDDLFLKSDGKFEKENIDNIILIGGTTKIPRIRELSLKQFSEKDEPIEIFDKFVFSSVCLGASLIEFKISQISETNAPKLRVSRSLGFGSEGFKMVKLIPINSEVPYENYTLVSTEVDNQSEIKLDVYLGESDFLTSNLNQKLGTVVLSDYPLHRAGLRRFKITFIYDSEKILNVSIEDVETNQSVSAKFHYDNKIIDMKINAK